MHDLGLEFEPQVYIILSLRTRSVQLLIGPVNVLDASDGLEGDMAGK